MAKDVIFDSVGPAVETFTSSIENVELIPGKPYPKTISSGLGEITVAIGLSGNTIKGVTLIHFNKDIALTLASSFFGIQSTEISDDVCDVCGEISNIVTGAIKTQAVGKGVTDFNITVPTITIGQNYRTMIKANSAPMVFPFDQKDGTGRLNIEIIIEETK